ncbi:hypothetical protein OnM2_039037b [Erysiphe neolycopersici]|uniref:Uncharacterized protein n=1 Tax=Erysiphe neolycopersici TaxID=212602 RepID=A0A420HWG9_9PEZI|nr:hypothetical protein OnM2_039037b [Erysiphe neolycopersici]
MDNENQYYETSENQPRSTNTTDSAPSWASQILRIQTSTSQDSLSDQRPGHSQPHPEKFTASDKSFYPQFRSLLEAKLPIDTRAIGNEAEKVWYGFGRLKGTASRRIHPWIEFAKNTERFTVEIFLNKLDKALEIPIRSPKP